MKIKNIKAKGFRVLSPDGFDLEGGKIYGSQAEAEAGLKEWSKRFEVQGYYSTIRNGERFRIPVAELSDYCTIQTI